jgi:drug/metabolite transporter (DMT)-like permease
VTYALALLSAACYGAADFVGGVTTRRASMLAVVIVSQLAGVLVLLAYLPFGPAVTVTTADLAWGGVAGVAGGIGVALLYRALALGTMAIVAPVSALCAVAIPVLADLAGGARLDRRATAGILLALLAIILISQARHAATPQPTRAGVPPGLAMALASGVAIGFFFLALARAAAAAGMWPLTAARATSVTLFVALALVTRHRVTMPCRTSWLAAGGGVLDMIANALYVLAARDGELSVVVTLASLYPASTVLLARVVFKERLSTTQIAGVACALVAVVLIAGSG